MKIQGASRAAEYAIVGCMRPAGRVFETPGVNHVILCIFEEKSLEDSEDIKFK